MRSNESPSRRPDEANKSSDWGARRDAGSNESPSRRPDDGGILEDATGNGGAPMEGRQWRGGGGTSAGQLFNNQI